MGILSKLFGEDAKQVDVLGKPLACLVCHHDTFYKRKAQLNSAGSSFLGLDWTDPTGLCVVCSQCGYIHWFLHA
jgi:hypothetical protein